MELGKSKIFLLFCLAFIAGVFLGNYVAPYVVYYVGTIAAAVFIAIITTFWGEKQFMIAGFLGLTMLAGMARFKTSFPYHDPNFVGTLYGQEEILQGIIVKEPDVRPDKINLTIRADDISGHILTTVGRYPEYEYGDVLKISGKIEEPFVSEEFSYKDYLSRFDTYAVMRFPKIEKIGSGQGSPVKTSLLSLKHKFQEVLSAVLPEPQNALVLGLILGLKRALPDDFKTALIAAGVSHIVVISGYNISIITRSILKSRFLVGRKIAFTLSVLVVLAFVILTGAEASVIRAAIMGLLLVFAMNVGRIYQARNALVFAAALMIAQNPKILGFDIGFQLSFAATLGLIYAAPVFEKWFEKLPNFLAFRTNLASTMAATLFTLPLLIYYFDRISLIAIPANALVLWVIPYAMFFGFLTGVVGMVYLPFAHAVSAFAWIFLSYIILAVDFFAQLPLASVAATIGAPIVILYYLFLAFALWLYRNKKKFFYQLEYVRQKI